MTSDSPSSTRLMIFIATVVIVLCASAAYLLLIRADSPTAPAGSVRVVDDAQRQALAALRRGAHVAFRHMAPGAEYGRLAFAPLDDPSARLVTRLACNRIHFTAAAGMCLSIARDPAGFRGYLLDDTPAVAHTLDLPGMPSRTRVSSDSRLSAYTVFVAGDSYLASGLSTRTRVVDIASGHEIGDLESYTVTLDGKIIQGADFNFWGVTFARDAMFFYATLGTGGRIYLVEGDVAGHTMRVIANDVECPSLSPDATRIAFKKKFGSGLEAWWQPAVIDLASREVRLLPEPRHIDDQIEWLDNGHILYALGHSISAAPRRSDVWKLAADAGSPPELFIRDAESPAVVRR